MASLAENRERVKVPNLLLGFKVKDKTLVAERLDRLEEVAKEFLESQPNFKDCLRRAQIAGHEYLVLSIDGTMLPWSEHVLENLKQYEKEEGDAEKLVEQIKKQKLVVAVGLRDDYLMVSIGSSSDLLARLGQGKRLIDRPELKPLARFADRRLTDIAYVSQRLATQAGTNKRDIDGVVQQVQEALGKLPLTKEQQSRIGKDVAALGKDLKTLIPQPGAELQFTFLTDRGYESYGYSWAENRELDASKPLGILSHLGGKPLMAVAGAHQVRAGAVRPAGQVGPGRLRLLRGLRPAADASQGAAAVRQVHEGRRAASEARQ